jgi:hypothetical protein
VVKDAALGIQAAVAQVYPRAEQRDDCFHALYLLGQVAGRPERKAYGAISEAEQARAKLGQCRRSGQGNRQRLEGQLGAATRRLNRAVELHDRFERAQRRAQEAPEVADLASGSLRQGAQMRAEITAAAQEMLMLGDKHCRKAGRYLKNRAEGLALHADELSRVLGTVSSVFGQRSVELSCLILRLWRGMSSKSQPWRRYEARAPLAAAYRELQELAGPQAGSVLAEVEFWLWQRHRASSAIEGFNAALRPYLYVHKGVTQGFPELFRAYYNLRTRRWGRHKGKSPQAIVTGAKVEDWLTLLGYPPSCQLN